MLSTAELQKVKVKGLEEGHRYIAEITQRRNALLEIMQDAHGSEWQTACDERYALKKAKNIIQTQMMQLVKNRQKAGLL